jgi:dTDP-4-dehydrorhamnose reductase
MKVAVLGASGVVGQHMMLSQPPGIEVEYVKRSTSFGMVGVDLSVASEAYAYVNSFKPDVIVNLAGVNNVDQVEASPDDYESINGELPWVLFRAHPAAKIVQVSSQAVFRGDNAPYGPYDAKEPINFYGGQKSRAETEAKLYENWVIARLTFVLGVRPFQDLGRRNPLEDMLEKDHQLQVNDRFFSTVFASDAAEILWELTLKAYDGEGIQEEHNIGEPRKLSRYDIASELIWATEYVHHPQITPVSHEYFPGLAARAENTQWAKGSLYKTDLATGLAEAYYKWKKDNQ